MKIALHKAVSGNELVRARGLNVKTNDNFTPVNLSICPVEAQSVTHPEALSILQDAIARVNSPSVLYDNLLIRDEYEASSVKHYVERLIGSAVAVFPADKRITIRKQLTDFALDPARLFPAGIIINELLTNIMKHAFAGREAGLITVSLRKVNDHAILTIQDDGNGLPESHDISTSKGFGHALVNMLSDQLGGRFSIDSGDGTTSILEFDLRRSFHNPGTHHSTKSSFIAPVRALSHRPPYWFVQTFYVTRVSG
ncbi:MAG: hypothetical protein EA384_07915 [Spirochaetaceae bacterium]|nr:MAG: hypothetical protein EA384_07915 [Spirochaetaceae bacterium]